MLILLPIGHILRTDLFLLLNKEFSRRGENFRVCWYFPSTSSPIQDEDLLAFVKVKEPEQRVEMKQGTTLPTDYPGA